jgi:acylphosphatase
VSGRSLERVHERYRAVGRVQGVGYRDRVRRAARTRGLVGRVRNREDGSVELEVQGSRADVDAAIAEIALPEGASVPREVRRVASLPVDPRLEDFVVDF